MKRSGRKTLLTAQLQRRICKLLAQGHTIATVSAMVSIGERTFYEWREKHPQFSQATTCAIGKSKIALVNKLRRSDDWRASAFLLERRFPAEFGRVDARPLPEPEEKKKINVAFIVNTGGKSLQEVASFPVISTEESMAPIEPEPESTAGELFDGNISHLGTVEHDLPFDSNSG
jgi:hypothetical protein